MHVTAIFIDLCELEVIMLISLSIVLVLAGGEILPTTMNHQLLVKM